MFPNLAALTSGKPRADLEAILLTGIPAGIVPGFHELHRRRRRPTCCGSTPPIPPAPSKPNILGVLGGDLAGFPNGRRVFDDVVTIELRAMAGRDLPAGRPVLHARRGRRLRHRRTDRAPASPTPYLASFPYLGVPYDGYDNPS